MEPESSLTRPQRLTSGSYLELRQIASIPPSVHFNNILLLHMLGLSQWGLTTVTPLGGDCEL
jgi:hypothetical protein